ncbi:hypothetical protein Y032_0168g194 [Ancylostoma ceylanicum]|nr:hypothetical protein Y032_0168g194 [Ancylostoma ceylanicum]
MKDRSLRARRVPTLSCFCIFLFVFGPVESCFSQVAAKNAYLSLFVTKGILTAEQRRRSAVTSGTRRARAAGSARSKTFHRLRTRSTHDALTGLHRKSSANQCVRLTTINCPLLIYRVTDRSRIMRLKAAPTEILTFEVSRSPCGWLPDNHNCNLNIEKSGLSV